MDITTYENTKLLLPFNGVNTGVVFPDYSITKHTVTAVGNAQTTTTGYKYYDSCGIFDGNGDYLTIPSHIAFDFGSNDMTIAFWFKTTQTTANATIMCREWGGSPYTAGWTIQINTAGSGKLSIYTTNYSTGSIFMTSSTGGYNDGNWHHFAWTKSGSSHKMFMDGVEKAAATLATAFSAAVKNITIGNDLTFGPRYYNGSLQDLIVANGTAMWTADFTPPTKLTGVISNLGSGVSAIKDDTNTAAVRRIWAAQRTINGRIFSTTSDSNGQYSLTVPYTEHDVIFEDDAAGTVFQDILVSHVTPT